MCPGELAARCWADGAEETALADGSAVSPGAALASCSLAQSEA